MPNVRNGYCCGSHFYLAGRQVANVQVISTNSNRPGYSFHMLPEKKLVSVSYIIKGHFPWISRMHPGGIEKS